MSTFSDQKSGYTAFPWHDKWVGYVQFNGVSEHAWAPVRGQKRQKQWGGAPGAILWMRKTMNEKLLTSSTKFDEDWSPRWKWMAVAPSRGSNLLDSGSQTSKPCRQHRSVAPLVPSEQWWGFLWKTPEDIRVRNGNDSSYLCIWVESEPSIIKKTSSISFCIFLFSLLNLLYPLFPWKLIKCLLCIKHFVGKFNITGFVTKQICTKELICM